MTLCKCEFCGRPFSGAGTKLCGECARQMDEAYVKVRKYIYQNPGRADFASIMEHTEVSEEALSYLIDKGRLTVDGPATRGSRCKACGVRIQNGMLCEQCRKKLISENLISSISQKMEEHESNQNPWKTKPLRPKDS